MGMDYPKLRPSTTTDKLSLPELMALYDELSALDLYVIPKQRHSKVPAIRYWRKGAPVIKDRRLIVQDQSKDDISGWCVVCGERSGRLVVLDFDTAEIINNGGDPAGTFQWVQSVSPNNFVLASPAGGVHMYYRLPPEFKMVGNLKPPVRGIDVRGEGGQVVTLGGFNLYENSEADPTGADKKGVPSGHRGTYEKLPDGQYDSIPLMSATLYEWLISKTPKETDGERYADTEQGSQRIEAHLKLPQNEQERVVQELLTFALNDWTKDKTYEEWLQLWMSAHVGSGGAASIRDFLLEHPAIYWRDGNRGRTHFKQAWDTFQAREGGYSVSSLYKLAKDGGWLTKTGYEIPERLFTETINVRYITEWLDKLAEVPKRLLLLSQTGSGKTVALTKLWHRLGQPKTVVFVPSIKLATELANTLKNEHGLPAELYRDNTKGVSRPAVELMDAGVLVTTLQTFATKVHAQGIRMQDYGLVYIEEADQLLIQFGRGGGGDYQSHVSTSEAKQGIACLRDAFENSGVVWCVDATMSRVTYNAAEAMRGQHTISVVKNWWVEPKAPVMLVNDIGIAYQEILRAAEQGKRVVVACDTRAEATRVGDMLSVLAPKKKCLVITRETERHPDVIAFMENVNEAAADYDVVVYNSVMASGVSVYRVCPDVVVQICTYLTPRMNLQMLNRYRQQKEVFCFYRFENRLFSRQAAAIYEEAQKRVDIEAVYANYPIAARTDDAELRAHITSLSVSDEEQQRRDAVAFYCALLEEDGREVKHGVASPVSNIIGQTNKALTAIRKEKKEELARTWIETPPIDAQHPAPSSYTPLQVAQGELHAEIRRALGGNIPKGVEPEIIAQIVEEFTPHLAALLSFVDQSRAVEKSERFLSDRGRAITNLVNHLTLMRVLALVHNVYRSVSDEIYEHQLEPAPFLTALAEQKDAYDSVIKDPRSKFAEVWKIEDEVERAMKFTKIILARIGLKQRLMNRHSGRRCWAIENRERLKQFLEWRGTEAPNTFEDTYIRERTAANTEYLKVYDAFSESQKAAALDMLVRGRVRSLETAIKAVQGESW